MSVSNIMPQKRYEAIAILYRGGKKLTCREGHLVTAGPPLGDTRHDVNVLLTECLTARKKSSNRCRPPSLLDCFFSNVCFAPFYMYTMHVFCMCPLNFIFRKKCIKHCFSILHSLTCKRGNK